MFLYVTVNCNVMLSLSVAGILLVLHSDALLSLSSMTLF